MIYKTFEEWADGQWLEDGEPRKQAYTRDELLLIEMGWNYGVDAARLSEPEPKPEPYGYIARRNWKMPVFIEADNVEATGLPYNNADYEPVFKAPLQREWVGLTTDEMKEIADRYHLKPPNVPVAFRAIEAKLKEKNT